MAHLGSLQVGVCLLCQAHNVVINNRTWLYNNQLEPASCAALLMHIINQTRFMESVLLIPLIQQAVEM